MVFVSVRFDVSIFLQNGCWKKVPKTKHQNEHGGAQAARWWNQMSSTASPSSSLTRMGIDGGSPEVAMVIGNQWGGSWGTTGKTCWVSRWSAVNFGTNQQSQKSIGGLPWQQSMVYWVNSVLFAHCHKYGQAKKMRIGLILRPWQIRFLVYLVSSSKSSNPQDVSDNKLCGVALKNWYNI